MPRECKKYRIRHTRKPARNPLLSSVVKTLDEDGKVGYCYIGFDAPLVELVGKRLSRGVAPYDPAYLSVEYDRVRKVWLVIARYLETGEHAKLWETAARPSWLKIVYSGEKDGKNGPAKSGGSRTGSRPGSGTREDGSAGSPGTTGGSPASTG